MNIQDKLFQRIDNSQLILFRMIFGFLLTAEAWGAIATGWVKRAFIDPKMNFPFFDFDFLHPLPGDGMIYYFILMGIFGIMVMLGFKYRTAMVAYALMWSGVYFMQKTSYNNHYYLMVLFTWLFCFVPANRAYSLDAKLNPKIKLNHCPRWCILLFQLLILVVYFYSAVAKMYPAWLNAVPIKIWFEAKRDYWLVGPLLTKTWFQYFVAWGGVIYDLLVGPALVWKKTRKYAFVASIFFHLFNSAVFQVGIFPYMGIAFGIFFFEPEKIRSIFFKSKEVFTEAKERIQPKFRTLTMISLALFLGIQILLPLRHWAIPGDVTWTEEGHRLSWRMMLRSKGGYLNLYIKDNITGQRQYVNQLDYLTNKQMRAMAGRPDMLWYFIQKLKKEYQEKGLQDFSIYAESQVVLNGALAKPLYDPEYDLAKAKWNKFGMNEWVTRNNVE